jgi:hypothetical protein
MRIISRFGELTIRRKPMIDSKKTGIPVLPAIGLIIYIGIILLLFITQPLVMTIVAVFLVILALREEITVSRKQLKKIGTSVLRVILGLACIGIPLALFIVFFPIMAIIIASLIGLLILSFFILRYFVIKYWLGGRPVNDELKEFILSLDTYKPKEELTDEELIELFACYLANLVLRIVCIGAIAYILVHFVIKYW